VLERCGGGRVVVNGDIVEGVWIGGDGDSPTVMVEVDRERGRLRIELY